MADTLGQKDLNGTFVNKILDGFANEDIIFKNFLTVTPTSNREMIYWEKTSGFITGPTTTGLTSSPVVGVAFGALPAVAEQSATKKTAFAKHFMIDSPWFTYADIRDSDPDMMAANVVDLRRAVENQVDFRILDVMSSGVHLSGSASGTGWGDGTNGNPYMDLLSGSTEIRKSGYPMGSIVAWVHPTNFKHLMNYFVTTKGSSAPQFSSSLVDDGVITKIANVRIVVSNNCTLGQVMMLTPQKSATWKTFTPTTGVTIDEPGVGTKIRVWEDGEVLFTNPKSAYLLKSVGVA